MANNEINEKKTSEKRRVDCPNEINEAFYEGFRRMDFDLFFTIMYKLRADNNCFPKFEAKIPFDEIKKIIGGDEKERPWRTNEEFNRKLPQICKKILSSGIVPVHDRQGSGAICLYTECVANQAKEYVKVRINPNSVKYFKNNLFAEKILYTPIDLNRFVKIKGRYAKTIYRLLLQYRTSDKPYLLTYDLFRRILDVPETYKYINILQKVINPAIEEILSVDERIKNLRCITLRASGPKSAITGFEFIFDWCPGHGKDVIRTQESHDEPDIEENEDDESDMFSVPEELPFS